MPTLNPENRLRSSRWLLLAMLGALQGLMLLDTASPWVYPLLVVHLLLFLLWQPIRQREAGYNVCVMLAAVLALHWFNGWAIAFWLVSLFGLVGARVFASRNRWVRMMNLSAMAYLCASLLLWIAPNLFADQAAIMAGRFVIGYVLPVLLLFIPLLDLLMRAVSLVSNEPAANEAAPYLAIEDNHTVGAPPSYSKMNNTCIEGAQAVNVVYSLLLFMLLALVMFGSLAFMILARLGYHEALLRTLSLMGLVWLVLIGLWHPNFGFSGIQSIFFRYLHSTPFESWFARLAEAAQRELDPASYLHRATSLLAGIPWLSGLSWHSPDGAGQLGQFSKHEVQIQEGELRLTLYARRSLNPAVLQHIHQLAQLVGYFYQAKQREQILRNITRLQAVYETGSRLTHDLKNMLQSLLCITALAQSKEQRAQQLLQQQLPLLAQRIELTLNKLQQPQSECETPQLALAAWWDAVQIRNRHHVIEWRAPDILPDKNIPATLFDCALDNLLENALRKRQFQPDIRIAVAICSDPVSQNIIISQQTVLHLTVCDSGDPIPETIAENLLRGVVVSEHGLGIGVYQVARWAEQLGYRLTLNSNQAGKVCFELRG